MKAIVYTKYGPLDVLKLEEIQKPTPGDDEVLVKVHASSVNYNNPAQVRGKPFLARLWFGLLKPKYTIPGGDIAGRVEAVGRNVMQYKPGDEVFGDISSCGFGAYAEYVCVPENLLALKPANLTFEEAAAVPQAAAYVALQALRDKGEIQSGQKVLIYGASGGIGTFAVQIAKAFGAEVTGVCSTRNLDMVRLIGADHVIDYTKEDFTKNGQRYDLILATAGYRSIFDSWAFSMEEFIWAPSLSPHPSVANYLTVELATLKDLSQELADLFNLTLPVPFKRQAHRMAGYQLVPELHVPTYLRESVENST